MASALVAFLSAFSAGVSLLFVSLLFEGRFDGSIDLIRDFVDAIVDADRRDRASFSGIVLVLVQFVEDIVFEVRQDSRRVRGVLLSRMRAARL